MSTAGYWLFLALRDAVPRSCHSPEPRFATFKQSLFKIGVHVVERAVRIRIHFASACPAVALLRPRADATPPRTRHSSADLPR